MYNAHAPSVVVVVGLQKYSFEVKRRLIDEASLPDSTAHLENMVSAFVSPARIAASCKQGSSKSAPILFHLPKMAPAKHDLACLAAAHNPFAVA